MVTLMGYKHLGPAFMDQLICAINGVYIAYIPINFANFFVDVRVRPRDGSSVERGCPQQQSVLCGYSTRNTVPASRAAHNIRMREL
jgi:hypothetical protein